MAQTARPETTEAERLLKAAQRFLEQRSFSKCSKYARQARLSDPTHPGPHQILAISTVLSASGTAAATNHYSILSLPSPTHNQNLIKTHFQNLSALLNPAQNPFALASQAHDLVLKAWSVLSNGSAKTRFDKSLKMGRDGGTFWTMCPYCYYVYEYANVYLDCCLRCQNVKCRKAYQALPLRSPPPPQEVVAKGRYACNGFFPVSGENGWGPFGPASSSSSSHVVIEIPDEEMEKKDVGSKSANAKVGAETEINEKVVGENVEKVESRGGIEIKEKAGGEKCEGNSEGFIQGRPEKEGGSNNNAKKGMRRKKMVSRNSTKFLKRGVTVRRDETAPAPEGVEGEEGKESDENSGDGMGSDQPSKAGVSVEFFDGDDDIFVGLQDIEK